MSTSSFLCALVVHTMKSAANYPLTKILIHFSLAVELELAPSNTADITNYFIKRIACDGKSARNLIPRLSLFLMIGMHRIFQGTDDKMIK